SAILCQAAAAWSESIRDSRTCQSAVRHPVPYTLCRRLGTLEFCDDCPWYPDAVPGPGARLAHRRHLPVNFRLVCRRQFRVVLEGIGIPETICRIEGRRIDTMSFPAWSSESGMKPF